MTAGLVLVAAGAGERLGDRGPKALVRLGDRPLIAHALDRVAAAGLSRIVVVHPAGHEAEFQAACADHADVLFATGGASRTDSVRAGLAALPAEATVVAVHDAARAFTPPSVLTTMRPWSSLGRKPFGTLLNRYAVPAMSVTESISIAVNRPGVRARPRIGR